MAILHQFTSELGEFFYLRKAAQTVLSRSDEQSTRVRGLWRSAKRRIAIAQSLSAEAELAVAFTLQRDALRAALAAHRAAAGETEVSGIEPVTVDAVIAIVGEAKAKAFDAAAVIELLERGSGDALSLDDVDEETFKRLRPSVEDVTTAVLGAIEVRTPNELRWVRGARWAAIALAAYLVLRSIYGMVFAPTDIARDKLVTVSSLHAASPPVQALVDGKKAALGAHTTVENEPWIMVDLGRRYALKRVHVQNRTDGYYDETLPWVVEIADGDGPFEPVGTLSTSIGDGSWDVDCGGRPATRVRVRSPRMGYLALGELSAYGDPVIVTPRLRSLLEARWFRFGFAVALLAMHLWAMKSLGHDKLHLDFDSARGGEVAFVPPDAPLAGPEEPTRWSRLLPARWDSQHYVGMTLRGYSECPAQDLRGANLPPLLTQCGFNFYPGYPAVASVVSRITRLPADYALFAVSLVSSLLFLFLWTGPAFSSALGIGTTYLSLVLLNLYTTGFALVTIQTEPLALLFTVAAFVALHRNALVVGALLAGAAGALRVTGGAIGVAFAFAVLARSLEGGPGRLGRALRSLPIMVLAGWGQLALFAYFWLRYKDPLLYVHAHGQAYAHKVTVADAFFPSTETVLAACTRGLHEGVFILFGALFLALGAREALRGFRLAERVYWITLAVVSIGIALVGSAGLAYAGMNRYWLMVPLLFFSMAVVLRKRPVALALWGAASFWHYWHVDLCVYLAQWDAGTVCELGYRP